jgi:hypothetical protein
MSDDPEQEERMKDLIEAGIAIFLCFLIIGIICLALIIKGP